MNVSPYGSIALWKRAVTYAKVLLGTALLAAVGSVAVAAPNAGQNIGNQASASYTDGSGTSRTVTSNTVTTYVQQVAGLNLTAPNTLTSSPGSTVYYPHTITNTGNGSDSYTLSTSQTGGFTLNNVQFFLDDGTGHPTGAAFTTTPAVAAGTSYKFIVQGVVPATATSAQVNNLTLTAASVFTPATTLSNLDKVTVTANAVVTVTKQISANSGPANSGPYTYTLTVTNTGNTAATAVTVTDTIPTGMTIVAGSGTSSFAPSVVPLTDAADGVEGSGPGINYSVTGSTVTAIVPTIGVSTSGTISFKVNVGAVAPGTLNNTAGLSYNDGSGATITGTSNTVPFTVSPTASLTFVGPAAIPSANSGSTVSFSNVLTNTGNATDSFDVVVNSGTSNFPAGTTFLLFKSDGVTPLVDTNGNSTPDTGPIAAGGTYTVVLKAVLPANFSGTPAGGYIVTKTATSKTDPTKTATATDTLTKIAAPTVDISNSVTVGAGAGPEVAAVLTVASNPGTSVTIPLLIKNTTTGTADSYDITSSASGSSSVALPTGWTVVYKVDGGAGNCSTTGATVTNTGTVNAGATATLCAIVSIPATGTGALAATTDVYFKSLSPATGAVDIVHDAVTVNPVRALSIQVNQQAQAYPGGTVVYSHTLTNNGNVTEGGGTLSTVVLTNADTKPGWTSVQYLDNGTTPGTLDAGDSVVPAGGIATLAPGASITIFNKVTAPSGANAGDIDTSTVTVTTTNGTNPGTAPATVSVQDATTVIVGNLTLLKEQALDAACNNTPGTFGTADITTGAVPGACIRYRITAKNVGSANATSIVVSDQTPAFTTYNVGGAAAATTVGTITAPAAGSTGQVQATIGTLAPNATAIVTFGVKINP